MESDTSKCGDECKLVEMLASRTSKEQALENAIAAVKTGKISQRAAARLHKVPFATLNEHLKRTGTVTGSGHHTAFPESTSTNKKVISAEERDQWWADHQGGFSTRKMVERYGRNRKTITDEIRRREALLVKPEAQSEEPGSEPLAKLKPLAPEPDPQPAPEAPAFVLKPPDVKPLPISPQERKRHYSQIKWVNERWVPATKALMEARRLLKDENTRLGDAYRHRENGGKMFTIPYQRLAKEWEEKGHLAEIAEALDIEDQGLNAELLKLEEVAKELEILAKSCASMASGMRMFTGCRPDNNLHP